MDATYPAVAATGLTRSRCHRNLVDAGWDLKNLDREVTYERRGLRVVALIHWLGRDD